MFEIVINTLEEMKQWEMYLFTLKLPFETKGTIYVMENSTTYFYGTEWVGEWYTLVTY